jgi:hypothetical protein
MIEQEHWAVVLECAPTGTGACVGRRRVVLAELRTGLVFFSCSPVLQGCGPGVDVGVGVGNLVFGCLRTLNDSVSCHM